MSIYLMSDLHGMYGLYLRMLETVQFGHNDHLYILGDMIDRGPDGVKILLDVMQRDNVTCLIGNHEHMMWHYLNRHGDSIGDAWMLPGNGGSRTLTPYSMLLSEERRLIRSFLDKLYLQVELSVGGKRFLLSHSSFLPDHGTLRWQDPKIRDEEVLDVVWSSPWRAGEYIDPSEYRKDGRHHIIGHVPVLLIPAEEWPGGEKPAMPHFYDDKENRVANIDLGCALIPGTRDGFYADEEGFNAASLCVLDLERYADGDPEPSIYLR